MVNLPAGRNEPGMVIPSVCDECSFLFHIIHCHPILIFIVLFTLLSFFFFTVWDSSRVVLRTLLICTIIF